MNHLFTALKNHERVEATRDTMDKYLRENNPRSAHFDAVSNLIS